MRFRQSPAIMRNQIGFTIIEIAIVLVIIGLLLGGVLKGQEMITSARVRNLISQQDGVRAAYFGFLDRYRALPGDYAAATNNIPNISSTGCTGNGNGNGRIENNATGAGATATEDILAWEHLSKAGFLSGSYTCAATDSDATTPINAFAVYIQLIWDNLFYDSTGLSANARHNLKTGAVPSDLLSEVDRKNDDGSAVSGTLRFSPYDGSAGALAGAGTCYSAAAPNQWNSSNSVANCGAAILF